MTYQEKDNMRCTCGWLAAIETTEGIEDWGHDQHKLDCMMERACRVLSKVQTSKDDHVRFSSVSLEIIASILAADDEGRPDEPAPCLYADTEFGRSEFHLHGYSGTCQRQQVYVTTPERSGAGGSPVTRVFAPMPPAHDSLYG